SFRSRFSTASNLLKLWCSSRKINRQARRGLRGGQIREELLHQLVLMRLVAHKHCTSPNIEGVSDLRKHILQGIKLVVHLNAQRLESTFRGVSTGSAGRCRDGVVQKLH